MSESPTFLTRRGRYRRLKKHKARAREVARTTRKRYVLSYAKFIEGLFQ